MRRMVQIKQPAASGLGLPAVRVSGSYFAPRRAYDKAWSDLIVAIMCPIGGRFMRRSFGSSLYRAVFAPLDQLLLADVARAVRTAAAQWCPNVRILNVVSAGPTEIPNNADYISIAISFTTTVDVNAQDTRIAQIDRSRIIQILSSFTLNQR